jgi:hypothetical protein
VEFRREASADERQRTERQDHKPASRMWRILAPSTASLHWPNLDEHQADSFPNVGELSSGVECEVDAAKHHV